MKSICQYDDERWVAAMPYLPGASFNLPTLVPLASTMLMFFIATEKEILHILEQKSNLTQQDHTSDLQATVISLLHCAFLFDDT
jgi:hypothetical protein